MDHNPAEHAAPGPDEDRLYEAILRAADANVRWRRWVWCGRGLLAVGAAMALVHLLQHLATRSGPSGWVDLVAGYPAAGLLLLLGGILAGRQAP